MTALNIWRDGESAYILNDTAVTGPAGEIQGFEPKTVRVPTGTGWLALALTGVNFTPAVLREMIRGHRYRHPADMVATIAPFLKGLDAELRSKSPPVAWTVGIAAAAYCPIERQPRLFVVGNDEEFLGEGYPRFELREVGYWTTGAEPYGPFDMTSPYADLSGFDAARDGLAMIEAQRRSPWPDDSYRIGGAAMLTTIGKRGIRTTELKRWPDVVGERIAEREIDAWSVA